MEGYPTEYQGTPTLPVAKREMLDPDYGARMKAMEEGLAFCGQPPTKLEYPKGLGFDASLLVSKAKEIVLESNLSYNVCNNTTMQGIMTVFRNEGNAIDQEAADTLQRNLQCTEGMAAQVHAKAAANRFLHRFFWWRNGYVRTTDTIAEVEVDDSNDHPEVVIQTKRKEFDLAKRLHLQAVN